MWSIKPLEGKYYGTKISNGKDQITVWTSFSTPVSSREIEEGWDEDYGYDHVESEKDYRMALVICSALNKEFL